MNRRIGLIALAVVLALAGTIAVYSYAHNADTRAVDATRAAHVLIAQKSVPPGTSWSDAVKGGYFSEERVPLNTAPSSAVGSLDDSIPLDEVTTAAIASGQIVVRPMFAAKGSATGILAIPKGKMAVSITLPSNADAAGFIQNGSDVAIYSTFKLDKDSVKGTPLAGKHGIGGTDLYTTKLLLPRVAVIATSQDSPSDLNGGKSTSTLTTNVLVTLAVTQAEAERLILSQQIGQLYLALLSDSSVTAPSGGVLNTLIIHPAPIFVR